MPGMLLTAYACSQSGSRLFVPGRAPRMQNAGCSRHFSTSGTLSESKWHVEKAL